MILLAAPISGLLVENVEGKVVGEIVEGIGRGTRAGRVHQVHQGTLDAGEAHALVPHFGESESKNSHANAKNSQTQLTCRCPGRRWP